MNTFAITLKQLRIGAGFKTQADLATELGVTQVAVGSWESGAKMPRPAMLQRLASLFGVSVDYLLGDGEKPIKKEEEDIRDRLHKQPGMRILFDAAEGVDDETLIRAADLLKSMKKASRPEESD